MGFLVIAASNAGLQPRRLMVASAAGCKPMLDGVARRIRSCQQHAGSVMARNTVAALHQTILVPFDGEQLQGHMPMAPRDQGDAVSNKHRGKPCQAAPCQSRRTLTNEAL